jgi:hypothetical protein
MPPRAPRDPNAPKKPRKVSPKPKLVYYVEGDEPGSLGTRHNEIKPACLESVQNGFKKIATLSWNTVSMNEDMKLELTPVTQ